jgi:translation initiation factor IF-3
VLNIPKNEHLINEEIRAPKVRLIMPNGEQKGIVSIQEALGIARNENFDLVEIAPKAEPPVCKIMDYGKFKFEQAKKLREAKKNQNIVEIKEIKLSIGIGEHDYDFKLRNALRFLEDGDKVKVSVRFKGREMAHVDFGTALINKFANNCSDKGIVEKPPKLEGRSMSLVIASKTGK